MSENQKQRLKYEERRIEITKSIGQLEGADAQEKRFNESLHLSASFMAEAYRQILALVNDSERIENKLGEIQADAKKNGEKITTII